MMLMVLVLVLMVVLVHEDNSAVWDGSSGGEGACATATRVGGKMLVPPML